MNPFFNVGLPIQQQLQQQQLQQQQLQQQQQQKTQSHQLPIMNNSQLLDLVNLISPNENIDPTVKQALIKLAESFVLDLSSKAADLARHRHSKAIELRDITLYLEREWDMTFPSSTSNRSNVPISDQIQRNVALTHAIGTKSSTRMTPNSTHISRNSQATRIANSAAALQHSTTMLPIPPKS